MCSRWSSLPLHAVGCGDADESEPVRDHLAQRLYKKESGIAQGRFLDDESVRVVVRVELVGEIAQVMYEHMRCALCGRDFHDLRIAAQALHQRELVAVGEQGEMGASSRGVERVAAIAQLLEHAGDARVRV